MGRAAVPRGQPGRNGHAGPGAKAGSALVNGNAQSGAGTCDQGTTQAGDGAWLLFAAAALDEFEAEAALDAQVAVRHLAVER